MKSIIAASVLLATASPAFAGPYANVENNSAWVGTDFAIGVTEVHAGYEFDAGEDVSIYVQGGPAFVYVDGEDTETEISGKLGIVADVTEQLELYGEVGFLTADQDFDTDELAVATKLGLTYRF